MAETSGHSFKKSNFLSDTDNEKIRNILGPQKECLALTVAQISFSNDSTSLANRERIMCFTKDNNTNTYFLYIYSTTIFSLIWKEKLEQDFGYVDNRDCHIFKCQSQDIKVKFRNTPEGEQFVAEVRKKFKLMDVIGSKKLDQERKKAELREKEKKKAKKVKEKSKKSVVRLTFGDPTNLTHMKHISTVCLEIDEIGEAGIERDEKHTGQHLRETFDAVDSPVKRPDLEEIKKPIAPTRKKKRAPPAPPKTNEMRENPHSHGREEINTNRYRRNEREDEYNNSDNYDDRRRRNGREDEYNSHHKQNSYNSYEREDTNRSRRNDSYNSYEKEESNRYRRNGRRDEYNTYEQDDSYNSYEEQDTNRYRRNRRRDEQEDNYNSYEEEDTHRHRGNRRRDEHQQDSYHREDMNKHRRNGRKNDEDDLRHRSNEREDEYNSHSYERNRRGNQSRRNEYNSYETSEDTIRRRRQGGYNFNDERQESHVNDNSSERGKVVRSRRDARDEEDSTSYQMERRQKQYPKAPPPLPVDFTKEVVEQSRKINRGKETEARLLENRTASSQQKQVRFAPPSQKSSGKKQNAMVPPPPSLPKFNQDNNNNSSSSDPRANLLESIRKGTTLRSVKKRDISRVDDGELSKNDLTAALSKAIQEREKAIQGKESDSESDQDFDDDY